jgi:SAM-dependent methyltransferase
MTYRDVVVAGYDELGPRYREWFLGSPNRIAYVQRVRQRLAPGSIVVDLGCGPGDPATRLLAADHHVLGVDVSPGQLRLAASAAPSALLVRADITEFALRPASVDAVVSFYALGHLPPPAHAPLFAAIATWLRPGGLLLTSAPRIPGDQVDEDWIGVPMYFGGIGDEATLAAVRTAGLTVEASEVVPEDEPDGHISRFHWITATKPPPATPPGQRKGCPAC